MAWRHVAGPLMAHSGRCERCGRQDTARPGCRKAGPRQGRDLHSKGVTRGRYVLGGGD